MCGVTLRETNCRVGELFGSCERGWVGKPWTTRMVRGVQRKNVSDWISACRELQVERTKIKGRSRKTWIECVKVDMKRFGLVKEDAHNRDKWRSLTTGAVQHCLSAVMREWFFMDCVLVTLNISSSSVWHIQKEYHIIVVPKKNWVTKSDNGNHSLNYIVWPLRTSVILR